MKEVWVVLHNYSIRGFGDQSPENITSIEKVFDTREKAETYISERKNRYKKPIWDSFDIEHKEVE